MISVWWHK